jgi:hypothetical protein
MKTVFVAAVIVAFLWLEWLMGRDAAAMGGVVPVGGQRTLGTATGSQVGADGSASSFGSKGAGKGMATPRMPRLPFKLPTLEQQFTQAKLRMRQITEGAVGSKGWRLQEAVLACRAVNNYWPGVGAMQAEAAYREGELWLRLEQPGDAVAAFQTCMDASDHQAGFAPRARMQLAHIHRRASRFGKAIHGYGLVELEPAATLRHLNDALEWQGRCWMELGQWSLAASRFEQWSDQAEGPLEQVRAADWQAQALLRAEQTTAAEILLSELQSRLRKRSLEPTPEGRELFEALGRIRAEVQLRAVRQFGKHHGNR